MLTRFAALTAACAILPLALAPLASGAPDPVPAIPVADTAPPPDGAVPSEPAATLTTPDGWTLTVAGTNETQVAVRPLTTALSSREYLVAGTFAGSAQGSGSSTLTGGTLEAGYQIGCGIAMDKVKLSGSLGISTSGSTLGGLVPTGLAFPIVGNIEVTLRPGEVLNVPVNKKSFKGAGAQITMKDIHIKIDGCVGQSFLRSYAVLTSTTENTSDVAAYYGVIKSV